MCSDGCRNFLTDATRLFHPGRANRKRGEVIIVNNYCAAIIFCLWHGGWIGNVDTLCWSEPLKWNSGAPLECTMLEDIKGVVLLNLMDVGRSLLSYFFREISFSTMIHLSTIRSTFLSLLSTNLFQRNRKLNKYLRISLIKFSSLLILINNTNSVALKIPFYQNRAKQDLSTYPHLFQRNRKLKSYHEYL